MSTGRAFNKLQGRSQALTTREPERSTRHRAPLGTGDFFVLVIYA